MKKFSMFLLMISMFLSIVFVNLSYVVKHGENLELNVSEFEQAQVSCSLLYNNSTSEDVKGNFIFELDENNNKLKVKNLSNVYVYARIVVFPCTRVENAIDGSNTISKDYLCIEGNNWSKNGNIYYYKKRIEPGGFSGDIGITIDKSQELNVENISVKAIPEVIQADPSDAVEEAWTNIKVDANGECCLITDVEN